MAKKKRNALTSILIFLFLISICALVLAGIWGVDQVVTSVAQRYGEPASNLSLSQRVRLSAELYMNGDELYFEPALLNDEMIFEVQFGESIYQISDQLSAVGYIKNQETFINYLIYRGYDTRIQAGRFVITQGMNAIDIADKLIDPIPEKQKFVVLAGWRAEEIAASIEMSGLNISTDEFLTAVNNPPGNWLPSRLTTIRSLEGYLAPGQYDLDRDINTADFTRTLINQFDENLDQTLYTAILDSGLTLDQAVILASIVEKESIHKEEMPMIASVFLNRYAIGMWLESDPTTQYALGYNEIQGTWWTNPLSYADLAVDSPFNTYMYGGLPPHAICNPSIEALRAIAYAADTPYYYFRAKCDGSGYHNFAVTYEEHLANGCE